MSLWFLSHSKGPYGGRELLIDLDDYMRPAPSKSGDSRGPYGEIFFRRRLGDAMRAERLVVEKVCLDHSNTSRHWHAIVLLKKPMPLMRRMIWQQRLGSDLMRAQADMMRADMGVKYPSLLIRREPMADFYRAPDRECECTRKHDTREQFELGERACPVWRELRGMTPWELFGPTTDGNYRARKLPVGNVPLEDILAVDREPLDFEDEPCEVCGDYGEPTTDGGCTRCSTAPVDFSRWGKEKVK